MDFNGGHFTWSEIESLLNGCPQSTSVPVEHLAQSAPGPQRAQANVPFAELHATSSYSFLNGASHPADMVERAVELGLSHLAIVDRDGFYGAVQFSTAARAHQLPTVYGAELSLSHGPLTVLARGPEGYKCLSHVISAAHMRTERKGEVAYPTLGVLADALADHCIVLVDPLWVPHLHTLLEAFGREGLVLEYRATMTPEDADHALAMDALDLPGIISARPAAARRADTRLAAAKRALAQRQSLAEAESRLHPMGATWLRSGEQMLQMSQRPDLVAATVDLAQELAFNLELIAPGLPDYVTPPGHTPMSWLWQLTLSRAQERYATRSEDIQRRAWHQIEHELKVIEQLNFPGYFLIINDLVEFCRHKNILCQGRGSAANSAVCFALGITNVEPISSGLLFERFLSAERDGPPDIDIDIESTRREEVIQYVYEKYGRDRAAQVANVNTYRRKGAVRDAARALGYAPGAADGWSKGLHEPPEDVATLAEQFLGQPRHLGIHSGGMVICDRPIADVVPTEWARKEKRSVIQWDKDDAAAAGLVKFDLLGLGMLEALHHMIDLVEQQHGRTVNLWELDLADPKIYEMLSRADAVGVFQVESRAQMSTLPRLKPQCFYDLVVEVALIRPGPIQGGSVHPYLRRRNGQEEVTFDHPVLEKSLGKTLGIPLFQEQLMQIAVDAAGFSGGEADQLRRAMGSKRSSEKMAALKERFYEGLGHVNNITGELADKLWNKIVAFAAYGFPESHSQSFASLVYFSAWFKYYYPAEFCVGLLRAQPMGFYSPQSLIQDARRHGVSILPVDVQHSAAEATVVDGAIRVGLNLVDGLSQNAAERIAEAAPFSSIADLSRRAHLNGAQTEALATAGALRTFGSRRETLWEAGVAATEHEGMLPGISGINAPALPGMNAFEMMVADIATTGVTHDCQPMELLRSSLIDVGLLTAAELAHIPDSTRVRVAGVVTHRQRPHTASGVTFIGMEDETGLINVMISPGLWARHRRVARTARALVVRGIVQNASGAVTLVADHLEALPVGEVLSRGSRDFR